MQFVRDFYKALDKVNELDLPYRVEASVGICSFNECKGEPIVSCIQKADMRMYENKKYRKSQGKKL